VAGSELVRAFAERGYVVVPRVASPDLVRRANSAVDELLAAESAGSPESGRLFLFPSFADVPVLGELLFGTGGFERAEELTGPGTLDRPGGVQVAVTRPPHDVLPGPHIDGIVVEADGRPGTFTMLAGIALSDQTRPAMGNLVVWPGSHLTYQDYFRRHGPDAFLATQGEPSVPLPVPEPVLAAPGDLVLVHHLLGHTVGPNTSNVVRRTAYFRLQRRGHRERWRAALQDAWLEYDEVRALLG
jgi:hypothetical protein